MSKLNWNQTGEHRYETGVKQGALYVQDEDGAYPKGVAWVGLTAVTESPSGAEPTALYADDAKYLTLLSAEEFGATVEAYTYPEEFAECDGSASIAPGVTIGQQKRKKFGMAYKSTIGNDVDSTDYGYKLHLIYGALAAPSEKAYNTINDNPEAVTFSWELSTTPVAVDGFKSTASVTIDSTKIDKKKLAALETILFGKDYELLTEEPADWSTNYKNYFTKSGTTYSAVADSSAPSWEAKKYYAAGADARLPLPAEIIEIMETVEAAG